MIERKGGVRSLFIAGTDTGAGKTIVTGCLAKYLSDKGCNVITQKWIQTGEASSFSCDVEMHLKLMGRDKNSIKEYLRFVSPYIFKAPCSPHLACRKKNKKIDAKRIIKSFDLLSKEFDSVIVEGAGGVLVPFDGRHLIIDIARSLKLPVLVVVGNKLGAINHTLLAIEALASRKIEILGLVFNSLEEKSNYILKDNPEIIKSLAKTRVFGILSRQASHKKLYKEFMPIGEKIFRAL